MTLKRHLRYFEGDYFSNFVREFPGTLPHGPPTLMLKLEGIPYQQNSCVCPILGSFEETLHNNYLYRVPDCNNFLDLSRCTCCNGYRKIHFQYMNGQRYQILTNMLLEVNIFPCFCHFNTLIFMPRYCPFLHHSEIIGPL